MIRFDTAIEAIKKASELAEFKGINYIVTFNRIYNKFLVWSDQEQASGQFIERVRADVHPNV